MATADERRERAHQPRAARDTHARDQQAARWSEQQERLQARRQESLPRTAGWEQVDRSSLEFQRHHWPQQWGLDQEVARREQQWRAALRPPVSSRNPLREPPLDQFRREARKGLHDMPLPAPQRRPVNRDVRRVSDAQAQAFFARHRSAEQLEQARAERPGPHTRLRMLRSREAEAPVPIALNDRLAARAGSAPERQRLARELYEEWALRRRLPELFEERGKRYAGEAIRDVQMDQAARREAGRAPLDEESAVLGRLEQLVLEHGLTEQEQVIFHRIRERSVERHAEQLREVWQRREQAPIVQDLRRRLPGIIEQRRPLHEPGIRQQIALEQAERSRRGSAPLDSEREVTRRVERAVIAHDLSPRDRETLETLRAARTQRTRERSSHEPTSPVVTPNRQPGAEL